MPGMEDGAHRLVERAPQLEALAAELARVRADAAGRMVFVGGEAGAGKTSLLSSFVADAGVPVWRGSAEPLHAPRALGPVLDVVAHAGRRLAALVPTGPAPVELVAAFAEEIRSEPGTIVLLEDLHWADEATLDFVRVLARRLDRVPVLVLVTYRDDEVGRTHPLRVVLGELATERRRGSRSSRGDRWRTPRRSTRSPGATPSSSPRCSPVATSPCRTRCVTRCSRVGRG
jgi:hypothetical protein